MPDSVSLKDHLFISYAWENAALAEWLTLKLTAEGYRVWCDRFKILGGERWPEDVDAAIRDNTFRMLHLVSKHSLHKPNPVKERELALALERERGGELLIPLNVDGTKPSDLPWRIVDVAFIPFELWGTGFAQLLKKLNSVAAPRPLGTGGREVAASVFLRREVLTDKEEVLISNCFPVAEMPKVIRRYRFSRRLSNFEYRELQLRWAFRSTGPWKLAFSPPGGVLPLGVSVEDQGAEEWQSGFVVQGIPADNLVSELTGKSLGVLCSARGLLREPSGPGFYFPLGLLENDKLRFENRNGKTTHIKVCGYRRFLGKGYRYHLCPWFRIRRDLGNGFLVQLRLRVHITDQWGGALSERSVLARRKQIGASWWNPQWLSRQDAVMQFLAREAAELGIGNEGEGRIVVSQAPLEGIVPRGIDEGFLEEIGAPMGLLREDEREREPA